MDHAIGASRGVMEDFQIGQLPSQRLRPGSGCGLRRIIGAGERQHAMAVADQLGDEGRADQARRTGNEYAHWRFLYVSHRHYHGNDSR